MRFLRSNFLAISIAAAVMFASSFGAYMTMPMGMDGQMLKCPFMNGTEQLCTMNGLEHFKSWQKLFLSVLQSKIVLLLVITIGFFWLTNVLSSIQSFAVSPQRKISSTGPPEFLNNTLLRGFGTGVLRKRE